MPDIITTTDKLKSLLERAKEIGYIALDTEFVWERTYYPKLGLIQLGFSQTECFLLDVLANVDLTPLGNVLANPEVVKILHDAQQDLTILRQATAAFPRNIFDTRYAAGFVGIRSTISLRDLISFTCQVTLPKTETRTNWLQRPLSSSQIEYALDDVRYLPRIREKLLTHIKESNREDWLREDLEEYDNTDLYANKDPYNQYLNVKGFGKLQDSELAVLRELAAWREKEARRQDRPRSWIIPDETLVHLAHYQPTSRNDLKTVKGIFDRHLRRYGNTLLSAVEKGTMVSQDQYPRRENDRRDYGSTKTLVDFGLAVVKGKSKGCGIDPVVIATRGEIKALVHDGHQATSKQHRILRGWRKKVLGDHLKLLLSE